MIRGLILMFLMLSVSGSGHADSSAPPASWNTTGVRWNNPSLWVQSAEHSIEFFNRNAWVSDCEVYLSRIDAKGNRLPGDQRSLIALSRMVYGLGYASEMSPRFAADYRHRARAVADFVLQKMIGRDSVGEYFLPIVDSHGQPLNAKGEVTAAPSELSIHEQAYGPNGLVALYKVTGDVQLLQRIRGLYESFYRRFHDSEKGGFFDKFDLKTQSANQTKSYDSSIYVASSFLFELAEVDPGFSSPAVPAYKDTLIEIADRVVTKFIDPQTGWLVENFDRDWNPEWRDWQKQAEGSVGVVGHNFQAAWLLLRMYETERGTARGEKYRDAAKTILNNMLAKPVFDLKNGGVFDVFVRETDQHMWHTNKAWWQQAEAIMALTLADRLGLFDSQPEVKALVTSHRDRAVEFYFRHFIDTQYGGEFPEVQSDGTPLMDKLKGDFGKSTYHTVELARYMLRYLL